MKQRTTILIAALVLAGVISCPSFAGIKMFASKVPAPRSIVEKTYLSDKNEAMERALSIHNLMNEMADMRISANALMKIQKQGKQMGSFLEKVDSCNVGKMGDVFKNPQEAWNKMMNAYEQQRQGAEEKLDDKNQMFSTSSQDREKDLVGWNVGRSIMMDVYKNPEKWGELKSDASFPLWRDQIFLYEKQWNQFYENLNNAYGVPKTGRPNVAEDVRYNPQKYGQVLAAHRAYVSQISKGKKVASSVQNAQPPKAPDPLPKWQDIVRADSKGRVYPEMPEPWKEMSKNEFKNYSPNGEMAEFFEGKSLRPTEAAQAGAESDLEKEYNIVLATDALQKGFAGAATSQNEMMQPVVKKLNKVGINTDGLDITDSRQYLDILKQLKALKKQSIAEAYSYIEKLEEQDKNNPELVERRKSQSQQQVNRVSKQAQSVGADIEGILQSGQTSPTTKQKLILHALEKDEDALVYLTETNAVDVDQLIRERRSTDKLIAESQQQYDYTLDQQEKAISSMSGCSL